MRSSSSLKAPTNSHPRWKLTHLPTIAACSGANYPCTRTWQAIENPHTSRRPCLKPAIRARKVSRASIALPYAASSGSTSRAKCCSDRRTACASLSSDAGTKISRSVPQSRTAARRSHTSSAGPAMANRSMNSSSSCLANPARPRGCAAGVDRRWPIDRVDIGPDRKRIRSRLPRRGDAPAQPFELRAECQVDTFRVPCGGGDRAATGGRYLHRHLREVAAVKPPNPAGRTVRQPYILATQEGLEVLQAALKRGD